MRFWALVLGFSMFSFAAHACSRDSDCEIPLGTYRIAMPESVNGPVGAIVFAHGYRGTAAGAMKNGGLVRMATDRGLAFIALDALGGDWALPNAPGHAVEERDEMAYLDAVVADAARFGVDPQRVVITGFSAGGMFVWNAICDRGDTYGGYIPYSGTFWQGPPDTCAAGTQNIVHVHGDSDETVPLEGRAIGDTRQGSVPDTLAMYRADKGFAGAEAMTVADMSCERAVSSGKHLDFCVFPGKHSFTAARLAAAYELLMQ
ncbi:MAG: alpha/beta hydrolase family esterase [Paracoccaceae bacterium]